MGGGEEEGSPKVKDDQEVERKRDPQRSRIGRWKGRGIRQGLGLGGGMEEGFTKAKDRKVERKRDSPRPMSKRWKRDPLGKMDIVDSDVGR